MSKATATPPTKRGRPRAKAPLKIRQNISIDRSVLKSGQKLACKDGMSFSAWLERMVRERIQITEP